MQENYISSKKQLQKALSEIIRKHRKELNKSISLASDEIGMTKSMWADLEKSIKDPQISTLWRISEGLNIPLSTIIIELEKQLGEKFTLIGQ